MYTCINKTVCCWDSLFVLVGLAYSFMLDGGPRIWPFCVYIFVCVSLLAMLHTVILPDWTLKRWSLSSFAFKSFEIWIGTKPNFSIFCEESIVKGWTNWAQLFQPILKNCQNSQLLLKVSNSFLPERQIQELFY